jgi:peptidyl-tRNA hydrolase, PTH1 family
MHLFVGLGNPGPKYVLNRHNIGFMVADEIASSYGFSAFRARFQGLLAEGSIGGERTMLLKPTTFMNDSGRSVGQALRFHKLEPEKVVVFYDDIDLKPGKMRVKLGGGHGGHNGLRSLDAHIGKEYWRIRIGVGHPGEKDRVKNYVLDDFSKPERQGWVAKLLEAVADEADMLTKGGQNSFMSKVALAVFPPPPKPPREKPIESNQPNSPARDTNKKED